MPDDAQPLTTSGAVSGPDSARRDLLELQARAERREQAAASLYASADQVLRQPRASALAGQAEAAFAGVRAATAHIRRQVAAVDPDAPNRVGELVRDAARADRFVVSQGRRLRTVVAQAHALAATPTSSAGVAAGARAVETEPSVSGRAPPTAPLSADDRRRYATAVRSYRDADACYRDLADDLSRAYRARQADPARNQDLRRGVLALYNRLGSLASAREGLASAGANGPSQMYQYQRQITRYVEQCVALQDALDQSR